MTKLKRFFKDKKYNSPFFAVLTVVLFYAALQLLGITCPIKYLTGISCAGCGMTRAYLSLLHLDLVNAFYYHPLFWLPPFFLVLYLKQTSIHTYIYRTIIFVSVLLFLLVYIYRMVWSSGTIVVCRPEDGLIFRFINIFL